MDNLFNSNTALGSAFGSIFSEPALTETANQSKGSSSAYRPTSISAHSNTATKICMDCHDQFPVKLATEVHPVPGLTMYRCAGCAATAAASVANRQVGANSEVEA